MRISLRKLSSSRTRKVTLQSAAETLELKPAKGKKRTRSTQEEAYRSRKDIIDYIDPKFVRQRRWKIEFDVQQNISGDDIDMLFQEEEDTGKTRSHRTYIGPGADGSSDDKIAVELRYHSKDNKLTFDPRWNDYVKTTFVQFRGEGWRCKEVDIPIGQVNDMSEDGVKPERSIMFVQPPAEFKNPTAYYTAWQDFEGCDFDFTAFENVKSFHPDLY